jgi:hypothetical protein
MVPIGRHYKNVEINDLWEKFTVSFTVFHPYQDANEQMRIVGTNTQLGDWIPSSEKRQMTARIGGSTIERGVPLKMYRSEKKYEWLT